MNFHLESHVTAYKIITEKGRGEEEREKCVREGGWGEEQENGVIFLI